MKSRSEMKSVKNKRAEEIAFSNRQNALCKKATYLSVLCGIEFAIIIFSIVGESFLFGKPDVGSVVDRFLQAKQSSTECSSSCRMIIEKICGHKREKMDKNKKKTIDDKEKGKGIEGTFEHSTLENFQGTDSERHEKLVQGINNLKRDLLKEIDELQSKIS
ncbi:hypothetical protein HAX54_038472, partial [Datura stramonium]|nr:hypothetical protein [Datura stramonium]